MQKFSWADYQQELTLEKIRMENVDLITDRKSTRPDKRDL